MKAYRCRDCNTQVLSFIDHDAQPVMTATPAMGRSPVIDTTPIIPIPAFSATSGETPALPGESHFSHFDKFTWKQVEGTPGVASKSLRMSDHCELQLLKLEPGAKTNVAGAKGIRMLYLVSGSGQRNGCELTPGWCGVQQADAGPVEFTADTECRLLVASYE
jgi:hypothetical protein